jgi:hypothetical protein
MWKKLIRKLKCIVGLHDWKPSWYGNRRGIMVGDRCPHCGIWHENAVGRTYEEIRIAEEDEWR